MKNRITLFFALLVTLNCPVVRAQSYTVLTDTFNITSTPFVTLHADRIITEDLPITFSWSVADCNFPADWVGALHYFSICDNSYCRYLSSLWPGGAHDSTFQYAAHDTGVLTLVINLPDTATSGCYYLTARLRNNDSFGASYVSETWIVCNNSATLGVPEITFAAEPMLYPNPVQNELHLRCDAGIIKVALYNTLGEEISVTACTNGNATVAMNGLPAGMYLARLTDANGTTKAVKKFTKE